MGELLKLIFGPLGMILGPIVAGLFDSSRFDELQEQNLGDREAGTDLLLGERNQPSVLSNFGLGDSLGIQTGGPAGGTTRTTVDPRVDPARQFTGRYSASGAPIYEREGGENKFRRTESFGTADGGLPLENLEDFFRTGGPSAEDTFRESLGGGPTPLAMPALDPRAFAFDPSGMLSGASAIADTLRGARLEPGSLFGQVGFPEADFDDRLKSALGGISASARGDVTRTRESQSARALASGRSLSEAQATSDAAVRSVEQGAGLRAQGARATFEGLGLQHGLTRASLQSGLATEEARINQGLDQAAASIQGGANVAAGGLEEASLGRQLGAGLGLEGLRKDIGGFNTATDVGIAQLLGGFSGADRTRGGNEQIAAMNALGMLLGVGVQERGIDAGLTGGAANILAGTERGFMPFRPLVNDAFGQWLMKQQIDAQKGGGGGSFDFSSDLGGILGGLIGMATKAMVCVDAHSLIAAPKGPKMLAEVQVGDEVYDADWEVRKVVRMDLGIPLEKDQDKYVSIVTTNGAITLTKDHVVAGQEAGKWGLHEQMNLATNVEPTSTVIVSIDPCECHLSGDLMLEGNADYIANGFPVASKLGELNEMLKENDDVATA